MAPTRLLHAAAAAIFIAGCEGRITTPSPAHLHPSGCEAPAAPPQPLRRLSGAQYQNVIADLFGPLSGRLIQGSLFPPTLIVRGFSGDADANTVNTEQSNAIEDNAQRI